MKVRHALTLAAMLAVLTTTARADEPTDREILRKAAIKWAGINCDKLVTDADFQAAIDFTNALPSETAASALSGVRSMISASEDTKAACLEVKDLLGN